MALSDYLKGPAHRRQAEELEGQLTELQGRYAQLQTLAKEYGAMEALEIRHQIAQEKAKLAEVRQAVQSAERDVAALAQKTSELRGQVLVLEETLLLESFALYEPKFRLNSSQEYKSRLEKVRERQKAMIKNGEAATGDMGWQVNGSKAEGRKLVNDMIKLVIRSFNNEADYCVDNVKFDNISLGEKRIRKSFEACNRLGG